LERKEKMPKKFALVGAAGYIAEKHLQAIKDVGGDLIAVLDPCDSVGILDRYFPKAYYFSEPERFERNVRKWGIDYLSICTPNYLHENHIRMALNMGADAICEKPLVINPENLGALEDLEKQTGKRVYPIMQMRYHPLVQWLMSQHLPPDPRVGVKYCTYRGPWYHYSWKGNKEKSGGLAMNIGVHLFDMLIHLFGRVQNIQILKKELGKIVGNLELEKATVFFYLNICSSSTFREIEIDGIVRGLDAGTFENLHTKCYQEILAGRGLSIDDVRPSLELVAQIEKEN